MNVRHSCRYKRLGEQKVREEKVRQMEKDEEEMKQKGLKVIDVKFRG